jgi:hypothetical protein
MTSFKVLGATLVLSALLATPPAAWGQASEPAAAAAQNPNFSIYSNYGRGYSGAMASQAQFGDASGPNMSVRPRRGHHTAKRY